MPFTYPYPRPAVTCDCVVFTVHADDLAVLLIQRKDDPFKGAWALPGGFVNENESLTRAASRELYEETGLSGLRLVQLGAYGDPGRDPRGHTITVAYAAFLLAPATLTAGDDAAGAEWLSIRSLDLSQPHVHETATKKKGKRPSAPPKRVAKGGSQKMRVAFDHGRILTDAYLRLRRHLDNPVRDPAFELLPPRFTIAELQRTYEVVLGKSFTPRAFRNQVLKTGLVVPASSRPAPKPATQLYRWNRK